MADRSTDLLTKWLAQTVEKSTSLYSKLSLGHPFCLALGHYYTTNDMINKKLVSGHPLVVVHAFILLCSSLSCVRPTWHPQLTWHQRHCFHRPFPLQSWPIQQRRLSPISQVFRRNISHEVSVHTYTHYCLYRPPGNWNSPGRPLFTGKNLAVAIKSDPGGNTVFDSLLPHCKFTIQVAFLHAQTL